MDNSIWIAFVTGLTAGGLSCMAVQGGLVTSSLAGQIENDLSLPPGKRKTGKPTKIKSRLAQPILLFLAAKIVAYTLLGFLLGALGSVFSLTPVMRGVLQIAIALFMLGNALRMLNVHPVFRYFSFEPPASIRRLIRRKAKNQQSNFSPIFLGLMTILIPCGITQAMMALAVSTGSPVSGAAILFAFTLGASPVFFLLTYLATKLGSLMEKYFMRFVALILLVFGFISMDAGLNLVGFPYTVSRLSSAVQAAAPNGSQLAVTHNSNSSGADVEILVKDDGYYPYRVVAPAGVPVRLHLVTKDTHSCSRAFVIPSLNIQKLLWETGEEVVEIPAQKAGSELAYSCSMGMYNGIVAFE